jgi:DNA primase
MIDQITVDKIINAAQIVEVVSDFVTLRKRGVNYVGLCPFHDERTPSFSVSPAKGICKCFSCGKGGNAVNFIMEHEQLSYYEALKYLAKKYHIEVIEKELTPEEIAKKNDRESMLALNKYAQGYFSNILTHSSDGKNIGMAYFRERSFRDEVIKKFQLGFSLDQRDAFSTEALSKGYKKEFLVKTGLSIERDDGKIYDRFWGRVMFPVHTLSGNVVAFGGRVLKKDDKTAKYVNSPESEIYHKSNELYGIFFAKQAIVKHDRCFLVEGYTDVISMHQSGVENVVASSGTSLTHGQIRLIHRFTENVTVIYDGDAAGIKASIRGINMLLEEGLNIKVVLLPAGEDPDSFAKNQNASDFIAYIDAHQTDFIRFKAGLLLEEAGKDPIKRAALIGDLVRSIAIIPNSIIRSVYVKECSSLLDVDEKLLYAEIGKVHRSTKERENSRTTPPAPPPAEDTASAPNNEENPSAVSYPQEEEERNIIRYLVRYGTMELYRAKPDEESEERSVTVGEYILDELARDHLQFQHPLYVHALQLFSDNFQKDNFTPEYYFVQHPDPIISHMATDLLAEKYVLSKIHSKMKKVEEDSEKLIELVPRVVFEYKNGILKSLIKKMLLKMKEAQEQKDNENLMLLQEEYAKLALIKSQLSKTLGERIIEPI